jgi:putative ABC transport system permease protein
MNGVALKMLFGETSKLLGLIFGMAFSTLLICQQASMFVGLISRTANQVSEIREPDIWIMDPTVEYADTVRPLRNTELARVRGVSGVAWAVPYFRGQAVITTPGAPLQNSFVYGLDDVTLVGLPRDFVVGTPDDLHRPDAIAIDLPGYKKIWPNDPVAAGKVIELNDRRAVVVAVLKTLPPFQTQPLVYTRYSQALTYTNNGRNQMSYVLAKTAEGKSVENVVREIMRQTGLKAIPADDFRWATILYYLRNTGIPINFGTVVMLGAIVGIAVVGLTFNMFVMDNLKQYAALKAMGVTNGRLMGMVTLQASVVGVVGYTLGLAVTALFFEMATASPTSFFRGFYLPWQIALGVAGVAMTIILLTAVFSLRRVLVVDPAVVFRG